MTRTIFLWTQWVCLILVSLCLAIPAMATDSSHEIRVVYHIDDSSAGRFALHIAEDQLDHHPNIQIAMVAYGAGVDFLLKDAKDRHDEPYAPAVQALLKRGVDFKVCSATLRFRDIPKEQVLPGMTFVPAGTYEVIRLQAEEGYVYLKP